MGVRYVVYVASFCELRRTHILFLKMTNPQ